MNELLLMRYLFNFVFIIGSGILIILGYKLFRYGKEDHKRLREKNVDIPKLIFSGTGTGLFFMVCGAIILFVSTLTLDDETPISKSSINRLESLRFRDDAIFKYVLKNQEEINKLKKELIKSQNLLLNLQKNVLTQNKHLNEFKAEINNSRFLIEDLNKNIVILNAIRDTLLSKQITYSKLYEYLKEQEIILSKTIAMLELLHNRQNILESTIIQLHTKDLEENNIHLKKNSDLLNIPLQKYKNIQ